MGKSSETDKPSGLARREQNLVRGRQKGSLNRKTRCLHELLNVPGTIDPKAYLLGVLSDETETTERRLHAASILLPYFHAKKPTTVSSNNRNLTPQRVEIVVYQPDDSEG